MATIFELRVMPQAGCQKALLDKAGRLKIFLKSPPENNRANKELVEYIAKALRVPVGSVTIVYGATSRIKRIKIDTAVSEAELLHALGLERLVQIKIG